MTEMSGVGEKDAGDGVSGRGGMKGEGEVRAESLCGNRRKGEWS